METKSTESTTQANDSTNQEQNPTKEVVKNPEAVLAKNQELLSKLSSRNAELEELRQWKTLQEQSEEEKKGNYQGVIASLRQENETLKREKDETVESFAFKTFESQVKAAAVSKGCVSPEKLMRLVTKDQLKSVQIDKSSFSVNNEDLNRLMDTLEEEHKDIGLFKKKNVNINNVTGGFKAETKPREKMSKEDLIEMIKKEAMK